jgi:hypothetical protein
MSDNPKNSAAANESSDPTPLPPPRGNDPTEALKQRLDESRLPPELKDAILADLPPPEERERLYREMQEKGGLSFEQLADTLGLALPPRS